MFCSETCSCVGIATIHPLGIFCFCLYKPKRILKNTIFVKVLRGVWAHSDTSIFFCDCTAFDVTKHHCKKPSASFRLGS